MFVYTCFLVEFLHFSVKQRKLQVFILCLFQFDKKAGWSYAGTWMTNVCNENGEVQISVLTSGEGCGLETMVAGIVKCYKNAEAQSPSILYIDRDCFGNNQMQRIFTAWQNLTIRLDVWHFMRRFVAGCTTDSHQL